MQLVGPAGDELPGLLWGIVLRSEQGRLLVPPPSPVQHPTSSSWKAERALSGHVMLAARHEAASGQLQSHRAHMQRLCRLARAPPVPGAQHGPQQEARLVHATQRGCRNLHPLAVSVTAGVLSTQAREEPMCLRSLKASSLCSTWRRQQCTASCHRHCMPDVLQGPSCEREPCSMACASQHERPGSHSVAHHLIAQALKGGQGEAGDPVLAQHHAGAEVARGLGNGWAGQAPWRLERPHPHPGHSQRLSRGADTAMPAVLSNERPS